MTWWRWLSLPRHGVDSTCQLEFPVLSSRYSQCPAGATFLHIHELIPCPERTYGLQKTSGDQDSATCLCYVPPPISHVRSDDQSPDLVLTSYILFAPSLHHTESTAIYYLSVPSVDQDQHRSRTRTIVLATSTRQCPELPARLAQRHGIWHSH